MELSFPALIIKQDPAVFPAPNPILGGRVGITDKWEGRWAWQPLHLVRGIVYLEQGVMFHHSKAKGAAPGLHLGGTLLLMTKPGHWQKGIIASWQAAHDFEIILDWKIREEIRPYLLYEQAYIFHKLDYSASIVAGCQFLIQNLLEVSIEGGWADFTSRSTELAAAYPAPFGQGGIYLSAALALRFQRKVK